MQRRSLLLGGAAIAALGSLPARVALAALERAGGPANGREVRVRGHLSPAKAGPGHYAILSEQPGAGDPCVGDCADWPDGLVRVYAAPGTALPAAGPVELVGRLHEGRFVDEVTGHAARRVMIARAL